MCLSSFSLHNHFGLRLFAQPKVNWEAKNLYERLGVKPKSTQEEIKSKYYELAKTYHPDTIHDDKEKEQAEKVMAAINAAYDVLKDPKTRREYDDSLQNHPFPFMYREQEQPVQTFQQEVHLSFIESAFGCNRIIKLPTTKACNKCNGRGTEDGSLPEACPLCGGNGLVSQGFFMFPCPACNGKGYNIKNPCTQCQGTGNVPDPTSIEVKIPAGADEGSVLHVSTPKGRVSIFCHVKSDPLINRSGYDLHITVPISIKTAIMGGVVEIPTLNGVVSKKVLSGTQPYDIEVMNGAGIAGKGDLYIHYRVQIPRSLSFKDKRAIKNMDDIKYMKSTNDMWQSNLKAFQDRIKPFSK